MTFSIVCNNPQGSGQFNEDDETLGDAAQSVFDMNDEDAELEWNGAVFNLNDKYDLGMMVDDLVSMIKAITATPKGDTNIEWVSSGFPFAWKINWSDYWISVSAIPRDSIAGRRIVGQEVLKVSKQQFVREWQSVLRLIGVRLASAGYGERFLSSLREASELVLAPEPG